MSWNEIDSNINGSFATDTLGSAVCISADGSIIAVSANGISANNRNGGYVRLYKKNGNEWEQIGSDITGEKAGDTFGSGLSLSDDGSIIAIGAKTNNPIAHSFYGVDIPLVIAGHVRVYQNINNQWVQIGSDIDGEAAGDLFGSSVSLSSNGDYLAVGAPRNQGVNGFWSGHVRVYKNINNTWVQQGSAINGEAYNDGSGSSISLSSDGSIIAIGAPKTQGMELVVGMFVFTKI